MSLRTLATCALLALHVLSVLAGTLDNRTADMRNLVMTPGGLIPKANVHAVPEGARIHHTLTEIHLISADNTIIHSSPFSKGISAKPNIPGASPAITSRALSSGYVAYAYWKNTAASPISTFSTSWPVPSTPTSTNGQLLYYFNGLVPDSFDAILQPVLQFGVSPAGGGAYWAVASWYVVGSSAYYSSLTKVNVGQALHGVMTLNSATSPYKWTSVFTGITSSSLSISTTEVLDWAYEALEIYTTASANNLPVGQTAMTGINIVTQNGQHPALAWTAVGDTTDGISMTVVSASSTNGTMQIKYPLSK